MIDQTTMREHSAIAVDLGRRTDSLEWRCDWTIAKYDVSELEDLAPAHVLAQMTSEQQLAALVSQGLEPFEVLERHGNLLMYGGASCQWQTLIGNGTTTAGQALTYFSNAQAAIGVGDSTTAAAATQTDLQAATNKLRKAMDASYPSHTDGTTSGAASIQFKATFGSTDANFAWQEWGVFNSATAATGRMLNRKVESLGTKASGTSWVMTVTLSLA